MHILVIDDDPAVQGVIEIMLKTEGFEVLTAGNGWEGLETIKSNPTIGLVITDILMPRKEGLETIQEMKRDFPKIKILAVSGGGRGSANVYLELAGKLGADSVLKKPFIKRQLLEAVHGLLKLDKI
ncbi:MAG: response regulator [Bacteroidetes bacterium]|nr:MAG: response regulator [Bacteroidota bacterium]